MKRFKATITQTVYIDIDSDAATVTHAEFLAKERARFFCAEGRTNTLGSWEGRGRPVNIVSIEEISETGRPIKKEGSK